MSSRDESLNHPGIFNQQVIENSGGVPFQLFFGQFVGDGQYKYVGQGIKKLLNVLPNEFTEKLFNSLVLEVIPLSEEIPTDPIECRQKMINGELSHYNADIRVKTRTGVEKWINDSSLPIRDPKTGIVIGVQGILFNIDDRKRVEKEKEHNISLLRATLESTADGILVVDASGKISDYNERFTQLWKIPESVLAPHNDDAAIVYVLNQLKNPNDFISRVRELYDTPDADSFDILEFKDGRYFERYSHPQKVGDKSVGRVWSFRDITERKRTEETLRESETKMRTLFTAMTDVILVLDDEGRYIEIAPTNPSLLYKPSSELLGKTLHEIFPRTQAEYFLHHVRQTLEMNRTIDLEYCLSINDKDVWFTARLSPLSPKTVMLVARDITERKQMEETLRASEERYRSLFDRMMDGVYRSTHEGKFVDVNDAMVKMFGFSSKEEMLQVDIKKDLYFAPSERDSLFLDTGQEKTEVFRMRRKDGSEIWVEDHGRYVHDEQGNVVFHEGILRDVTERLRTEVLQNAIFQISQGASQASTLDDLFKSLHGIISTVMPARNFYIALYDEATDLISFPYFVDEVDVPSPPIRPGKGLTEYVLRTGKSLLCDESTDLKLRQHGAIELVGVPSPIWLGVPLIINHKTIGVMAVQHYSDPHAYGSTDLQMLEFVSSQIAKAIEQKRSEEQLRKSEEQFRLISENVADLIAVIDLQGKRLYNSPSYKGVLGDPSVLKGTDSFQEIHPDDRERIRQLFQEIVKTGIGRRTEYRFLLKDGSIRHIESQSSVIKDKEGNTSQVLVVSRDVTEQKKLEQQFLRSQRMESIGTLAGGVAHDLNNVLAPIMMSLETLGKRFTDQNSEKLISTLAASAQRGADIVKQVLAFARGIEGERVVLQPKHIINEVVKIAKETFPRSIELRTDIPKNLWTISADPTQMHQVLLNICVNARDAMPDGGNLAISAENILIDENYSQSHLEAKAGHYVLISISDTGIGIPSNILDKIFEPFFTTKEFGKGTGLGLSTVHAIVKSHGGFLNVDSDVGKGTKFYVYLPANMQDQAIPAEIHEGSLYDGHGELILVIDDEAAIREITKSTLETHGYHVIIANDGAEGIALYNQYKEATKVVLTDLLMPIMDGVATINVIRKMNPNVKIIAASGMTTEGNTAKIQNGGAQAFLSKPYTAEKLLTTIYKVLNV